MAGSYRHCVAVTKAGKRKFIGSELLDHLGDAYEALEEMFDMIEHLSGGDPTKIHEAHEAHCRKRYGGVHCKQTVEEFFVRHYGDDGEDEDDNG